MRHLLLALTLPLVATASPISLSKPVAESHAPDLLYWAFDGGDLGQSTPAIIKDGSGNDYEGYLSAAHDDRMPVYAEGRFGTALRFDGTDGIKRDPFVRWKSTETPGKDETGLDLAGKSFTFGAWVRIPSQGDGEPQTAVIVEREVTGPKHGNAWSLYAIGTPNGQWRLRVHFPNSYHDAANPAINFSDDEWHHVGLSVEVSGNTSTLSFWFDGALVTSQTVETVLAEIDDPAMERVLTVGERMRSHHHTNCTLLIDDLFLTSGVHTFEP